MTSLFCALFVVSFAGSVHTISYGYSQNQGADWPADNPLCYEGVYSHQTPIDIRPAHAREDVGLGQFSFSAQWQDTVTDGDLKNNEHTFQFSDNDGNRTVTGGGLEGTYTFLQLHFHFGSLSSQAGAEHLLDGYRFPGEVHFVLQNAADFSPNQAGHLAVLGFFLEIGEEDNTLLEPIISRIGEVSDYNSASTAAVDGQINLSELPSTPGLDRYFRYLGSLTTPTCDPVVVWTVFEDPLIVSTHQYDALLGMVDGNGTRIENNFRRLMPLNARVVFRSPGTSSGAASLLATTVVWLLALRCLH